jgi:hypothetical protein
VWCYLADGDRKKSEPPASRAQHTGHSRHRRHDDMTDGQTA